MKEEQGYTMGQKKMRVQYETRKNYTLILRWLLFFDTDSTDRKVEGTLSDRKMLGVHMSVLNFIVPLERERKINLFLPT